MEWFELKLIHPPYPSTPHILDSAYPCFGAGPSELLIIPAQTVCHAQRHKARVLAEDTSIYLTTGRIEER